MADDRERSGGVSRDKFSWEPSVGSQPEDGFLPPLTLEVDQPDLRYEKLSGIVAEHVLSRLQALHAQAAAPSGPPRSSEIEELASLLLGPRHEEAAGFLLKLRDGGISLDDLHTELLEPTARYLGELWEKDRIDFVDVTLGVSRLQRLVHAFEGLGQIASYDDKRRVLLACAPGEQHSLGSSIVQKFLRAAGWHVWTCTTQHMDEAAEIVAQEWFGVVGFSVNSDIHLGQLASSITRVRQASVNRTVGIMVGGSAIARDPQWVEKLGADGTAINGPATVILAKTLLAKSLASGST
ncbi:B12-binding domain-containing protein [Aestuariivirga sp.]|jgi:methanogenic corrinoid protein MtbC1|uniref:B12-binding domain-containing protein n=1 Tax=Aestuariivirga sp. TaxID=2650926 RepID=UPI0037852E6C